MKQGFPPVIDQRTKVLILGSFPGEESLKKQEYYGHPRNQFWKLLASLIQQDLVNIPYQKRLQVVLENGFGIWDVYEKCLRKGSLDSNIRNAANNSLENISKLGPNIELICMNGKTAGKFEKKLQALGFKTLVVASSSPAYATLNFEQKLQDWKRILDLIDSSQHQHVHNTLQQDT